MSSQNDRIEVMLIRQQMFMDELVNQLERRQANTIYELMRAIIWAWTQARRTT